MKRTLPKFLAALVSKITPFKNLSALLVVVLLMSGGAWGQTNPSAFDLSTGSFSFASQTATSTTYPTNIQGWATSANNISTAETTIPSADQSLVASGTSTTSGLSNLGANGFQFLSTSSSPNRKVGSICVGLNTIGRQNILINWTAQDMTSSSGTTMGLSFQYRIGTSGVFTDFGASTLYQTLSSSQNSAQTYTNISLPVICENKPIVQIRWIYYQIGSTGTVRDALRIDDITVSSSSMPACSGTPAPGDTIASANPVSSGSSTILSLQNAITGTGVTYQWKSSTDNITYTTISGATSTTYTATPSAATYYVCDVSCSGVTTSSNPIQVTLTYCMPTSSSSSTYFSGFTTSGGVTNISNNSTAFSSGGYVNYSSSMAVSQFATSTVNFSATIVGGTAGIAIYVDYNNDLDFTDLGETVYNSGAYQPTGTTNSSFVIPSGTALGNYRMRIITDFNATSPTSCAFASGSRGEIEDYLLTVVAQPTCMVPTALTSTVISYQTATIGWTAPASGTSPASYDYEVRTSGTAGSGATGLVTSGSITSPTVSASLTGLTGGTAYSYYVRSNCGSGDYSSWTSSTFTTSSCSVPTAVTSSAITTTTATISWTAPAGSPAGYEYELRTSGAAGSGATGLVASGTITAPTVSANLTGLTAATSYLVYVRTNCYSGFNSSWTSSVTLATQCDNVTTFPSTENFATYLAPCWQEGDLGDLTAGPSTIGSSTTSDWVEDGFLNSGTTGSAKMNIDAATGSEWLLSPFYTIPATGFRVKYSVGATNWNATTAVTNWEADDFVDLLVSTSNTNWTVLKTYNASNVPSHLGQVDNVDISAYNGQTVRFAFRAFEGTGDGSADIDFFIDNFTIEQTPNTWTGTTSSSWNTSGNWSLNTVPTSSDNIVISSNGTTPPLLDVDVTIPVGKSLTISGTGTLTIAPGKTLTIAGTANFGGKAVTIKSNATGNGAIGQVTGTLSGATNVTVERYIPAKRSWRAITAPVTMATSINANWQEGGTANTSNGFDIWDSNGGTGIITGGVGSSLLEYNSSANTWTGITNTTAASSMLNGSVNKPFMAFVTGPYGSNNVATGAAVTTLRATGTLLTGDKTYATTANKYTFIGNPYASPLNLTAMLNNTSNATASFGGNVWVWDANVLGTYSVGTYNLFDFAASNYSNTSNNANISGAQIQSGQAFFVKSTDGASFTIKEAHKGSVFTNAVFRSGTPEILRVNLFKQVNNEWAGRDGAMEVIFSDAAADQAPNKMANGSENIAFTKNGALFASEHHLPLVATDVLKVKVWNTIAGANYKLKINTEQFTSTNLNATLEDLFTNSRTPLTLDGSMVEYPFAVTTDALSSGDRFRIVFQNAVLGTNNPTANGFSIVPNPVTGDSFQVNLGMLATGDYSYSICNAIGQEVEKGSIQNATQNTNYTVKFKENAATGIYIMKIKGTDNSVFTAKIIKK